MTFIYYDLFCQHIYIYKIQTYAREIGLRLGLSLPSPVGITITIHCTNQYIKVTCIMDSICLYSTWKKIQFIGSWGIRKTVASSTLIPGKAFISSSFGLAVFCITSTSLYHRKFKVDLFICFFLRKCHQFYIKSYVLGFSWSRFGKAILIDTNNI